MNNFMVGGAVSITFVTILNRYRERDEEAEGERVLFTVLNLMTLVLSAATIVLMFFAVPFIRFTNHGFTAEQVVLCAHMTRILLPAQIFLFIGSIFSAALQFRKQFLYQAVTPLIYNVCIIGSGVLCTTGWVFRPWPSARPWGLFRVVRSQCTGHSPCRCALSLGH